MGLFGKTKVERLLLRLYGRDNVDCMNLQSGSGGTLADLRSMIWDRTDKLTERADSASERILKLESQIAKMQQSKKVTRRK